MSKSVFIEYLAFAETPGTLNNIEPVPSEKYVVLEVTVEAVGLFTVKSDGKTSIEET